MKILNTKQQQYGLSMIELMVALLISSLLMLGVFEIFLTSNQNNRYAHSYARVQESGRLAMDILTRHLRMAGYQGCIDPELIDMNILANDAPTTDLSADGVFGYESDDSASWDIGNRNSDLDPIVNVPDGTDIIYIQYVSPTGINVICTGGGNSCTAVNANIKVANNTTLLEQNDIVVVSDCESADMFEITNTPGTGETTLAHASSGNTSNNLSKTYDEGSRVYGYNALAFYVSDTGRNDAQGGSIFSLYQFDALEQLSSELVEGVEQLQIQYGQRLSNGNLRFVPADDGAIDFSEVEAVRVSLLISGSEPVLPENDTATYQLGDVAVAPAGTGGAEATHPVDRRLRQTFTTTLFMRNLR